MPGQTIRSFLGTPPAAPPVRAPEVPFNGYYPKVLKGRTKVDGTGGSVWLVTAPNTGVIIQLANRPQKAKHRLGFYSTRLVEHKMVAHNGVITIQASA